MATKAATVSYWKSRLAVLPFYQLSRVQGLGTFSSTFNYTTRHWGKWHLEGYKNGRCARLREHCQQHQCRLKNQLVIGCNRANTFKWGQKNLCLKNARLSQCTVYSISKLSFVHDTLWVSDKSTEQSNACFTHAQLFFEQGKN